MKYADPFGLSSRSRNPTFFHVWTFIKIFFKQTVLYDLLSERNKAFVIKLMSDRI